MSTTLVGKKLGKYTVTGILGQGGMATVYLGHQDDIDRDVAIKVLAPHPGQDARFVSRFRTEARTIARLQHPHILPVYDYGDQDGILYLVMAYVRGGTLSDRIRRGALGIPEAERLIREIGGALDYAHRQNVIHRDIKPANILLDHEGHALLTDFGIARLIEDSTASGLTGTGNLIGTPSYMSPEQAQSIELDHRSDQYALGVIAFEMLTGRQPFPGDTAMQTVMKHINAPPPLHLLPPPFVPVIGRALAKTAQERYPSVAEFAADFSRAAHGEATGTLIVPEQPTVVFGDAGALPPTGAYTPPTGTAGYPAAQPPPTYPGYPTQPAPTPPTGTTTIIQQQTISPLVLLGAFAIIAVMVVVVVLIVARPAPPPPVIEVDANGTPSVVLPPIVGAAPTTAPVQAAPAVPVFGRVAFSSGRALGDTVSVRVDDLAPPGSGSYTAWLVNETSGDVRLLGTISVDALGAGALSYTDADGAALPARFNQLLITVETTPGDAPSDDVRYRGGVPSVVPGALMEILKNSPDGLPVRGAAPTAEPGYTAEPVQTTTSSLIQGAIAEAQIARQHAGLAARANSVGSMRTHAEHTINILLGREGEADLDGNGRTENPGRGFGVAYFLDRIDDRLMQIIDAPDATPALQSQTELIRVCIVNARDWVDEIIARERIMLAADSLAAVTLEIQESTLFAQRLIEGYDLNGNGQVEAFEGECGLSQIVDYGVSVANFPIVRGES